MNRTAFTLIEMLLVITLMAIISGAAALKLTYSLREVCTDQAMQRMRELDDLARNAATRMGESTQLTIDLDRDRLAYHEASDSIDHDVIQLGNGQIVEVVVEDNRTTFGQVAIDYSVSGYTSNYSICVMDSEQRRHWFQVFGLTKTAKITDDPIQADRFIQAISKSRDDPH